MNSPAPPRLATWLLGVFLPATERETIPGDLAEEFAFIVQGDGNARANRWYWRQTVTSVAPMLRSNIRRGGWLKTAGSVVVAYIVVALLVVAGDLASRRLMAPGELPFTRVSLLIAFPVMMLGGYLAERMRPRAARALAILFTLMGFVSLAITRDTAPFWYQIALIVIGPTTSLVGGRMRHAGSKEDLRI
jgi:hypothetical protein